MDENTEKSLDSMLGEYAARAALSRNLAERKKAERDGSIDRFNDLAEKVLQRVTQEFADKFMKMGHTASVVHDPVRANVTLTFVLDGNGPKRSVIFNYNVDRHCVRVTESPHLGGPESGKTFVLPDMTRENVASILLAAMAPILE